MNINEIIIKGAREHNLKNVNLVIPRNKLIVMTGLSGSGKSSLAFDTIYAEGQRRYVESLSSYARQFLGQMEKPDVDYIEGLSPAISIDQKTTSRNPRSTVGTVTEIHDYLRLMFARIGVPHCPKCGKPIQQQTVDQIVDQILALPERTRLMILAPVVRGRKGEYVKLLEDMDFGDIVISIKSSDVRMTYDAYRIAAEKTTHPFHVGITEAGTLRRGQVKSATGIGALLLAGIGDTIRVSLTSDPVNEVYFARDILEAIGERKPKFDIVSCPTCGRTKIDLEPLVDEVERRLDCEEGLPEGLRIAVMGCVVNGPGEAREADFGVCGGDKEGLIIRRGEIVKKVPEEDLAEELMAAIRHPCE